MKKTLGCVLSMVCLVSLSTLSTAAQATEKKHHQTTTTHTSKTTEKSTSKTKKSTSKSSSSKGKKTSAAAESSSELHCKSVRVKTSHGYRTEHKCRTADAALHSPVGAGDMNGQSTSGKQPELKARTIPDRAYAVDGYTFFHQGRKYRIVGIDEALVPAGSDLAKQRLQLALDSGAISVEPQTVDENGTMRAVVRVGGKNLADVLNASH